MQDIRNLGGNQTEAFFTFQIHISLVNGRPGASNFSYSQALQVNMLFSKMAAAVL